MLQELQLYHKGESVNQAILGEIFNNSQFNAIFTGYDIEFSEIAFFDSLQGNRNFRS
jgi:hypothetical protein